MRILRCFGGFILILAGLFLSLIVYLNSGGLDGWQQFRLEKMIEKHLIFAIGCPLALVLGVGLANTGSRRNFWLGILLAFLPLLLVVPVGARDARDGLPWLIAAGALALASSVVAALGRKAA